MELVCQSRLFVELYELTVHRANLTNMIWVEQPVGTGFTQGTPTATSQEESAAQFLGFWKNFMETFGLVGKKVYIAGES
jgi:carboxypeptidase D